MDKRDFDRLSDFIYQASGIKMPFTKKNMLEGRLRRRLRITGLPTFGAYCTFLFQQNGLETEAVHLLDVVTTNKTDFFREPNHFDFMVSDALPDLEGRGIRRIRAWSSACSTGEEPYTLAMVLSEFAQQRRSGLDFSVLGTDLSTEVLAHAQAGIYATERVQPVPSVMKGKYVMQPVDRKRRDVRIVPRLRSKVGFARFNLMDPTYGVGEPMHLIFCRNVLIYFDRKTQTHVLTQLCKCLAPGGYLFIGHSESAAGIALPVTQVANTIFQKHV